MGRDRPPLLSAPRRGRALALGIDVGTTAVKVVAVDAGGTIRARGQREYPLATPAPGWVELDPRTVWRATRQAVGRVTAALPRTPEAVAISSLGEAFAPLDAHGRPLGAAIVSFDRRALPEHARAMETIGRTRFEAGTGIRPLPHHAAFKWLWWQRERPEVFARTRTFLGLGGWVAMQLGAQAVIDPSLAVRTAVYDPIGARWDEALVEALGLAPDLLPTVLASSAACGTVSVGAGARTGLDAGIPIVVGGLDQACAAHGLAIEGPTGSFTLGTTAVICLSRPEREVIPMAIPAAPHVEPGRWLAIAGTPAGGSTLRWFRDVVAGAPGRRARARPTYERLVDEASVRRTSVLFLPHLGGSRVAWDDPAATGAFLGLTHATDRTDLARAVLDGVAYETATMLQRLHAGGLSVTGLRANGGGSRSAAWMGIVADATGVPVASTASDDAAAYGAARLALEHAQPGEPVPALPDVFRVEPRGEWQGYHAERLGRTIASYEALRSIRETRETRGGDP